MPTERFPKPYRVGALPSMFHPLGQVKTLAGETFSVRRSAGLGMLLVRCLRRCRRSLSPLFKGRGYPDPHLRRPS